MARIRTIKPDHWEDECWSRVSLNAHLLWIGMKNFADDQGVIKDNHVLIKNKVFPTHENLSTTQVSEWIAELEKEHLIRHISYNGKGYFVLDFSDERIDKPQPSILPNDVLNNLKKNEPPEKSNTIPEHSGMVENTTAGEYKGKESIKERSSISIKESISTGEEYSFRDEELENSILNYFGFTVHQNFDKARIVKEFCFSLNNSGQLDHFRNQFDAYRDYKEICEGYKHSFKNFIGEQKKLFQNGGWNAENWQLKLKEEQSKTNLTNKAKPKRGFDALSNFSEVTMNENLK